MQASQGWWRRRGEQEPAAVQPLAAQARSAAVALLLRQVGATAADQLPAAARPLVAPHQQPAAGPRRRPLLELQEDTDE